MLQQLINHSPDLKRLQDEGYELEVKGGYLLIHHIPYVTHLREVKYGILVSELSLANSQRTIKPSTHVINFIGEYPCNADGSIITAIQHSNQQNLGHGIVIDFSFSNKPQNGYADYYEKVSTYGTIISSPAKSIDPLVTEKTFRIRENEIDTDVFQYIDTNSGRAKINLINDKVKGQKIAIIGLGGTGAYILDLLSKTPVSEIHIYDGDVFSQHNAFRSPGAAGKEDLDTVPSKVDYYFNQYSKIHQKITAHHNYVSKDRDDEAFLETLKAIQKSIDDTRHNWASYECKRPTIDKTENLLAKYSSETRKKSFLDALDSLITSGKQAIEAKSKKDACSKWQKHLGDRFPCSVIEEKDEDVAKAFTSADQLRYDNKSA